jgi:hypothetical protein
LLFGHTPPAKEEFDPFGEFKARPGALQDRYPWNWRLLPPEEPLCDRVKWNRGLLQLANAHQRGKVRFSVVACPT